MSGPAKSSTSAIRSETIVLTDPSIPRARKWMLTTAAPVTQITQSTNRITVYLGPVETSVADTNAHRHGIVCVRQLDGQAQATALSKDKIMKELRLLGLEPVTYLQPCKDFRACVEYAFKADVSLVPDELAKQLSLNKHTIKAKEFLETQAQKIIAEFDEKPTFNEFKQKLIGSNFTFPEQLIKRAYEHMEFKKENRFVKTFERIKRSTALPSMPAELGSKLFFKITKKFGNIKWGDSNLNHFDLQIALLCLAIEARDHTKKEIEISPHICLTGSAGKGKTLLGKMLYPTSIASLMTNDSQGVGQLQLGPKRKMFKMDDLPAAILRDHKIAASIKSMYHNDWSAKIHGSKENNKAAAVFITTNEADPLLKLSDVSDLKAIERRFIIGTISELEKAPKIDRLYSVNRSTSDDIIIQILRRINSKLHTHECHNDLQVAKEYVCAFAQAILLDEERTPDVGASRIEGGSVPHRGAASEESGDCAGPQTDGNQSNQRSCSPSKPTGNGTRHKTIRKRKASKRTKDGDTHLLPEKKTRISGKKDSGKCTIDLCYESLSDNDVDTNSRTNSGETSTRKDNSGDTGKLVSSLVIKLKDHMGLPDQGVDNRRDNEMAPVLGDGSVPISGADILATAFAETIGEPTGTTDDELLAFAAEIELGDQFI